MILGLTHHVVGLTKDLLTGALLAWRLVTSASNHEEELTPTRMPTR